VTETEPRRRKVERGMTIRHACLLVSVLVGIANASSAGRIRDTSAFSLASGLSRYGSRVPLFEPQLASKNLALRGGAANVDENLALRGGAANVKPVNEADAAQLKGKTIVFISAGYEAKKYILDIANARGVKTIVFDEPVSWASPSNPNTLDKEGAIHKFFGMDMNRADEILVPDILEQLAKYTKETGGKIDGVCSFVEVLS
jgi:hypothetical protein